MPEAGNDRQGKSVGAIVLVALGVVANIVGIAGTVSAWGSTTKVVAVAAPSASTTTAAPGASTTIAAAPAETPVQFVVALDHAFQTHDVSFLVKHLHPDVIARYGTAACRAFVRTINDHLVVRGKASTPGPYLYSSGGKTVEVQNVVTVPVTATSPGTRPTDTNVHTVVVDGTYRFFTRCTKN